MAHHSELSGSLESLLRLKQSLQSQCAVDEHLAADICKHLQPSLQSMDWNTQAPESARVCLLLEIAVAAIQNYTGDCLPLVMSIAAYMNPQVPWSNAAYSAISSTMDVHKRPSLDSISEYLSSRMFISKDSELRSAKDRKQRYAKMKGLRPALGFSASTASQDQKRHYWKTSPSVLSLSQVYLLLDGNTSATSAVCASFILQILEDADVLFKAQGLFLLSRFLDQNGQYLVKSGLIPLYKEEVAVCLTYLPELTPALVSMRLMNEAYPVLRRIVDLEVSAGLSSDAYTPYIEIVVSHLLGSISHVSRSKEEQTNRLQAFFLHEISTLLEMRLGTAVLVCASRLFYILNQLVTDPFVIDLDGGSLVVDAALKVQNTILCIFRAADTEAAVLLLRYKFDLLACWAVLAKRIVNYKVGTSESRLLLQQNCALLREISMKVPNAEAEFDEDQAAVLEKVPEMKQILAA